MRILHICNYYMEGMGYQENYLPSNQLNILGTVNDNDVQLFSSDRNFPFDNYERTYHKLLGPRIKKEKEFITSGVKVCYSKPIFEIAKRSNLLFNPFKLYRFFKKSRPTIVHLHGATNLNVVFVLLFKFSFDFKLFIDCHADETNSSVESFSNKFFYFFFRILYRISTSHIEKFLPITRSSSKYLEESLGINKNKITLTPLGYEDSEFYKDEVSSKSFLLSNGLSDTNYIFGVFGKFSKSKKTVDAIELFSKILSSLDSKTASLLLVGSGDEAYDNAIDSMIKERGLEHITMRLPLLGRNDLRAALSSCDFVFWLGTASNSIQEAMGCGAVPLLGSNDAYSHLIIDRRQLIVSLEDSGNVLELMDSDISNKVSKFAVENLTWKKIAELHLNIYKGGDF